MIVSLEALKLYCNRCGWSWLRRTAEEPKQCPACKSKFWGKPRVRAIAPERRVARNENFENSTAGRSHARARRRTERERKRTGGGYTAAVGRSDRNRSGSSRRRRAEA